MLQLRFTLLALGVGVGLFLAMLVFLELGRRLGLRAVAKRGPQGREGIGVVDSAVYGLLALLIGFTFSGAAERFDQRRQFVTDEVNVAGTAWQRIDLLSAEQQPPVRDAFRRYVDALIAWYAAAPGSASPIHEPAAMKRAQNDVWSTSLAACLTAAGERARVLLLPSLNEMFGAVEKERMARRMHPPIVIWLMLFVAALAAALFAGYALAGTARRNWIYIVGFAATVSVATYVIVELEYPRLGLFRVNAIDQTLIELRATIGEDEQH